MPFNTSKTMPFNLGQILQIVGSVSCVSAITAGTIVSALITGKNMFRHGLMTAIGGVALIAQYGLIMRLYYEEPKCDTDDHNE